MIREAILALSLMSGALHAQDEGPQRPSPLHVFAGVAVPSSAQNYAVGPLVGFTSDIPFRSPVLGWRVEGSYASFKPGTVRRPIATVFSSPLPVDRTSELGFNLNGVLWSPYLNALPIRSYVDAGGSYSRLSDYATSGGVTYSHAGNHVGFNGGVGIDFPLAQFRARLDGRYKQIAVDGSQFKTMLLTFGVRF